MGDSAKPLRHAAARTAAAKSPDAYRTIGEVADLLGLPHHVLRFWESRFSQLKPLKRGGNRRYYRPEDVALLKAIKILLYEEGLTIRGVQKRLREEGKQALVAAVLGAREDSGAAGGDTEEEPAGARADADPAAAPRAATKGHGPAPGEGGTEEIVRRLKRIRALLEDDDSGGRSGAGGAP